MLKRLLMSVAAALALAGPAVAGEALDAIRARGVLRVGTTGDYKPFTFRRADGSYYGADIEMAKRLADRLGVKLELVPTVWAKLADDFKARKFDVAMGGVTILPARTQLGDFSAVTYVDGKRPVARCADKDRFTSIGAIDRPDVRVVVNPGASNEQFARERFPHAKLTVHNDNATVFDEIVADREDVMVTDGIEVDHQALIHPELCAAHVPAPFTRLEKAYWMPRDKELLALVDAWLADEKASGNWDRILEAAQKAP
jgi:cyclohexadienyl dehydratase